MTRWIVVAGFALGCSTNAEHKVERVGNPSEAELLKRFAFAQCLRLDGMESRSVARSISFNRQEGRSPDWKYAQLEDCARRYLESRTSTLTTDLGVEKCLDFLESPQLAFAVAGKENAKISCASDYPKVEPSKKPPSLE